MWATTTLRGLVAANLTVKIVRCLHVHLAPLLAITFRSSSFARVSTLALLPALFLPRSASPACSLTGAVPPLPCAVSLTSLFFSSIEDVQTGRIKVPEFFSVVPEHRVQQIMKSCDILKHEVVYAAASLMFCVFLQALLW